MNALAVAAVCLAFAAGPDAETLKSFRDGFVALPASGGANKTLPGLVAVHRHETTQALYESLMGANPSRWKGPRNSVEMTSYADATEFCRKATLALRDAKLIADDEEVRLPTEAEWEVAARGGTTTAYSFGDDAKKLGDYAWFHGNAAGNDPPVGVKKPNAFGLYDMHGYVWEWCTPDDSSEKQAALRGGSWKDDAEKLTVAHRRTAATDLLDDAVGFRCVLAKASKTAP